MRCSLVGEGEAMNDFFEFLIFLSFVAVMVLISAFVITVSKNFLGWWYSI